MAQGFGFLAVGRGVEHLSGKTVSLCLLLIGGVSGRERGTGTVGNRVEGEVGMPYLVKGETWVTRNGEVAVECNILDFLLCFSVDPVVLAIGSS